MTERPPAGRPGWASDHPFVGMSVCFTGTSVCTVYGFHILRPDSQRLAEQAGLVVKLAVSPGLDILVMGNPNPISGKARKAASLGVQVMDEREFWLVVGLPVD